MDRQLIFVVVFFTLIASCRCQQNATPNAQSAVDAHQEMLLAGQEAKEEALAQAKKKMNNVQSLMKNYKEMAQSAQQVGMRTPNITLKK